MAAPAISLVTSTATGVVVSGSSTNYFPLGQGPQILGGTNEVVLQTTWRRSGTISKLSLYLSANSSTGCVARTRKNAADGNQSVSPGSSATGWFTDSTNTDSVSAADKLDYKVVAATGGSTVADLTVVWADTNNTSCRFVCASSAGTSNYVMSQGDVSSLSGDLGLHADSGEADVQLYMSGAGTMANLLFNVATNNSATATVTLRQNAADTALTLSVSSGSTGIFEDTTHTVTVARGDLMCHHETITLGVSMSATLAAVDFYTTNGSAMHSNYITGGHLISSTVVVYAPIAGYDGSPIAEPTAAKIKIQQAATYSYLSVNINSGNTANTSTVRLRKNGANGNQVITVPSGTGAGIYTDSSHTDSIAVNDLVDYSITNGASGNLTFDGFGILQQIPLPGTPGDAVVAQAGTGFPAVGVSWGAALGSPTGYKVDRALDSAFTSSLVTTDVGLVTSWTDATSVGGNTYYYRVRAYNAAGDGPNDNYGSIVVPAPPNWVLASLESVHRASRW